MTVHGIALEKILAQNRCSPNTEFCTLYGLYPITNRYYNI
ncbi:Uncharacterised protein [Segatella copri]|nr:Uncharacterised protein [Segatella copri]